MRKRIILSLILVPLLAITGYLGYMWYSYAAILKKQEEQWFNEEFRPLSFNGVVELEESEEQEFFVTLYIQTNTERFSYGLCTNKNKEFKSFVETGDSAIKYENNVQITFIKKNGEQRTFQLPFCNLIL